MRVQGPEADVLEAVIAFANGDHSKTVSPQTIASGEALSKRVGEGEGIAELDRAYLLTLFFIAKGDPELHVVLHQLNDILLNRFHRTGDRRELNASLNAGKAAWASLPPGHPMLRSITAYLGTSILTRYEIGRDFQDLELAIQVASRVVAADHAAARKQSPEFDVLMGALTEARNSPHDESESDIIMEAIRLVLTVVDDPSWNGMLADFGVKLRSRYMRTGSRQDLNESIDVLRKAARLVSPDHPQASSPWYFLSSVLLSRYLVTGDVTDLDEGLAASRRSLQHSEPTSPAHPTDLHQVALLLYHRYKRTGNDGDLDEMIDLEKRATRLMSRNHPDRGNVLQSLSLAMAKRHDRTGDLADLDDTVMTLRQALEIDGASPSQKALYLSTLGVVLKQRFEAIGARSDIDDAVEAHREARAITPRESQDYANCVSNLGSALRSRYERTFARADLDESVECVHEVLALTPEGHPNRAGYLSDLCVVLWHRSVWTEDPDDLAEAIAVAKKGLELLPEGHADRGLFLHNLGSAYWGRFTITGDFTDADAALTISRESLDRTPPGPDRARYLAGLQILHQTRYENGDDIADLDAIIAIAHEALPIDGADGETRMTIAQAGASAAMTKHRISHADHDLEHALAFYQQAVDALPILAMRGLDESDIRIRLDQSAASLGRDAAACAIAAGKSELAIKYAEAGRGVMWSRLLDLRSELAGLHQSYPDLAEELEELRLALAAERPPVKDTGFASPMSDHSFERIKVGQRFDQLITRIRSLPPTIAFSDPQRFLAPPSAEELTLHIGDGVAVLINVSVWRCDAIILTSDEVHTLPLSFTAEEAEATASRYLAALHQEDQFGLEMTTRTVAQWMWNTFAGPILDQVDRIRGDGQASPRIWWCPTGPLTLLPVHAAGHHLPGSSRTVIDRAVSSYTPTLRALALARRRTPRLRQPSGLAVAVSRTPRPTGGSTATYSDLPGTRLELQKLQHQFGEYAFTTLEDAEATKEAVITGLRSHPWVHIACHGTQDLQNPTDGGLVPYDWLTEGLIKISDLTAVAGGERELAFLSACQTATGGVVNLDEAVHLAAAMQHAGWLHVIGTLWTIDDGVAATVAERFYRTLVRDRQFESSASGHALHQAVRELRASDPTRLVHWARFVHLGP